MKGKLLASVALFSLATTSFALNDNKPTATIAFTSKDNAKAIVYSSYETLYQLNTLLKNLSAIATNAASGTHSAAQLQIIDQKFQNDKKELERMLSQQTPVSFMAFNDNEISIDMKDDGNGNHLIFNLPKMDVQDLNLNNDSLTSVENAELSVTHITQAIDRINNMLPSSVSTSQLKPFVMTKSENPPHSVNQFEVSATEDSHAILQSLVSLHDLLVKNLTAMLKTANDAAHGTHTMTELGNLDTTFQAQVNDLERTLKTSSYFGNIKGFNDTRLTMVDDRKYHFIKLDMATFNLSKDNLSNAGDAETALLHLNNAFAWISDWTITGTSDYANEIVNN